MIELPPTPTMRKAAAFVEKLAALEVEFGYRLGVGTMAHGVEYFEPVTFGPNDVFALVRISDDELPGGLTLALAESP